jgi:hypothetical protein
MFANNATNRTRINQIDIGGVSSAASARARLQVRATIITGVNAGATAVIMVRAFKIVQSILLFDPRCEHSSVPTAGSLGPSRAGLSPGRALTARARLRC